MILIDVNVLIYAYNEDAPLHNEARAWLDRQLNDAIVGLPWSVLTGFLRVSTNPRVMPVPLTAEKAIERIDAWLDLDNVHVPEPTDNHWPVLSRLLLRAGTAGNLTSDAHLAAIAIEHGALVCSADNDFNRFQGVQFHNPFEANQVNEPLLSYG